jgi:chromosome partitioning protein
MAEIGERGDNVAGDRDAGHPLNPADVPLPGPRIVVVGNHKGGTGKSTVAMHVVVALIDSGKRVATFDLDLEQQTLTRYIENRHEWARQNGVVLGLPRHVPIVAPDWTGAEDGEAGAVERFIGALADLQSGIDVIVIDTPAGPHQLSLLAHGMADTLVTPINDSFVDLDLMVMIGPAGGSAPRPSRYAKAVAAALAGRRNVCGRPSDWVVVRNRIPPASRRGDRAVGNALDLIAPQVGFRTVAGLAERPVFRQLFPFGLTAFDPWSGPVAGVKPKMSQLLARVEMRGLVEALGLIPPQAIAEDDAGSRPEIIGSWLSGQESPAPSAAIEG